MRKKEKNRPRETSLRAKEAGLARPAWLLRRLMAGKKGTRAVAPVQDVTQQPPGGWPVVQAGTQMAGFFFSWSVALRLSLALLLTLPILLLMLPLLLIETLLLAALILMTLKIYLNSFLLVRCTVLSPGPR